MNKKDTWFTPHVLNVHNVEKLIWDGCPRIYVLGDLQNNKVKVKQLRMSKNAKEDLKNSIGKYPVFMYKPMKYNLNTHQNNQQSLQLA